MMAASSAPVPYPFPSRVVSCGIRVADKFLYVFKAGLSGPLRRQPQPKDGPIPPTPAPLPSARPSAQAAPTQARQARPRRRAKAHPASALQCPQRPADHSLQAGLDPIVGRGRATTARVKGAPRR